MFLMCADPLRGQVGGGWALGNQKFMSPVKWHQADRQVPFGAKKLEISRAHSLPLAQVMDMHASKIITYTYKSYCRYTGSLMYKSLWVTLTGCKGVS